MQKTLFSKDGHNPHDPDTCLTKEGISFISTLKLSRLHSCLNQWNRWNWHWASSGSSLHWLEVSSASLRDRKRPRLGALANKSGWTLSKHHLPVMWGYPLGHPTPVSLQLTPAQPHLTATAWAIPSANHPHEPGQITELSDRIKFDFKPLSFGVVCYVAKTNLQNL